MQEVESMPLTQFDLNLLTAFDAIYSESSLTRAGKRLHVTQPAMSRALGKLREQLKDPLFVRHGVNMIPTPLARSIIGQVRQGLQTLETTVCEMHFDPASVTRLFRLGMHENMEVLVLPLLLNRLRQSAPGTSIFSVEIDRRQIESALSDGVVDAIIDIQVPHSKDIQEMEVYSSSRVVVANRNHPGINGKLDLDTYLSQSHILVSRRHKGVGCEDLELSRQGKQRVIAARCQHFSAACRIVSQTDLLLTMPRAWAQSENAPFRNRVYPFPFPAPLKYCLYWHADVAADPANRWLREEIEKLLAQYYQEEKTLSVVASKWGSEKSRVAFDRTTLPTVVHR
jgi:DNA-binding transcriptional LysR family regulator